MSFSSLSFASSFNNADSFDGKSGRIEAIIGPMFGGKSSKLIQKANIIQRCKKPVYIVAPDMSRRKQTEMETIVSHNGSVPLCETVYLPCANLKEHCDALIKQFKEKCEDAKKAGLMPEPQVICIDEAQFFSNLIESCCALRREGIIVVVAGLTLTFERKPFGEMHALLDYADEVIVRKAVCAFCNTWNATLTHRTSAEKGVVVVGGEDMYKPVCQLCFERCNNE